MNTDIAIVAAEFVAHKRALGRKYDTEQATLRLLLTFADQRGLDDLRQLTPALLDEFVASRHRQRARSYNHLVGVLGCFLDWAVTQQRLDASPLRTTRRRVTDQRLPFLFATTPARQLLAAARSLPDRTHPGGMITTPGGANIHAERRPRWASSGDHTHLALADSPHPPIWVSGDLQRRRSRAWSRPAPGRAPLRRRTQPQAPPHTGPLDYEAGPNSPPDGIDRGAIDRRRGGEQPHNTVREHSAGPSSTTANDLAL